MSIAPRGSQRRRLSLLEGGRRVAVLVAVAGVAGTATLTPAVAGNAPPDTCETVPMGVTAGPDGQPVACDPAVAADLPSDQPDATSPATTTASPASTAVPAPTASAPAPASGPASPSAAEPAAAADPAPVAQPTAAAEPPAAADGTQPRPPVDPPPPARGATPATEPHARVPGGGAQEGAAPASPRPSDSNVRRRDADRGERRSRRRTTDRDARAHAPAAGQDVSSLAVPSDWASLEPIVLPQFSPDDFPVPAHLLPLYQAAAAEYGLPWEVLAAINEVETRYGQNVGVSTAGAVGFMQFLPSTWERWGRDADGDRRRDPYDPADAVFSAARYLHAAGAAQDLGGAIFAYNHSTAYVAQVVTRARELAGLDPDQVTALTEQALEQHRELYQVDGSPFFGPGVVDPTPGQVLLMTGPQLTRRVLQDERIDLYACGREDVEAGRVDARVLATLFFLAESGFSLQVSSLECGHGVMTASGNVSAHSYGAAVDIAAVDGTPIAGHQGPGSITEDVLRRLVDLQGRMRPNQIISLMTLDQATNTLAMADHADHIHVGFPRAVELPQR
ncbi:MAG TPA: lytic transglycosylase domain-containing protein [Baekduia sp.]|uniref:lytic transglycosylase domain-containing protein n=1 Tax=Baekduia sp. TaxID=2600305 RepID=UPI002CD64A30|nr:lytic transglycosylase domain-containing protein [Baekduia sp.]HMJ32748.1 lytic transglycosylase domain-containing protein [Baekduia sp.]